MHVFIFLFELFKVCKEISESWSDKLTSIPFSEMDGEEIFALRRLISRSSG